MKLTIDKVLQITFYAVIAYLILVHNRGANRLLQSTFGGYAKGVRALQGR